MLSIAVSTFPKYQHLCSMSSAVLSVLPKLVTNRLHALFALSFASHKSIKLVLLCSALVHFAEFVWCALFFQHTAAPYFAPPIATLMNGDESFLYAHSITRQYGFLVIQLSLVTALFATQPERYAPCIRLLAGARLLMASLGTYSFANGTITLWQLLPSLTIDISLAIALWRLAPTAEKPLSAQEILPTLNTKSFFRFSLSPLMQWRALQFICVIAGVLWILWGLGSTVFWEIGVANISSDSTAERYLLESMQANAIVRNQQGIVLIAIGAITAFAARNPMAYSKVIDFIIAQQIINAISAAVELGFGTILLGQFFTVFSVQVVTLLLFASLKFSVGDEPKPDSVMMPDTAEAR
jgi:hypothetical protein